jgi:D-aminoacyl-tRNA deacylase
MVCIVYTRIDEASQKMGSGVVKILGAEEREPANGMRRFGTGGIDIIETGRRIIDDIGLDSLVKTDYFIFLSRHKSARGIPSFTVHPEGNWSDEAQDGGRPKMLSMASPWQMRDVLKRIKAHNTTDISVTYEATHHGPLLDTPSFFVEAGGNELGQVHYDIVARAVCGHVLGRASTAGEAAIGLGGTHYPEKFTRLALEDKYAFCHMMPRHNCGNTDMIEKALERSVPAARLAVLEWKGFGSSDQREAAVNKLSELGIDYVKV